MSQRKTIGKVKMTFNFKNLQEKIYIILAHFFPNANTLPFNKNVFEILI
jgi:hypothetical protein